MEKEELTEKEQWILFFHILGTYIATTIAVVCGALIIRKIIEWIDMN